MARPKDVRFLETHEWARKAKHDGKDVVELGITDFAVQALGDLTFVDLPRVGDALVKGKSFGEIESVKAVSDMYAAVSGTVVAVNEGLKDNLDPVAKDPFGSGWMVRLTPSNPAEFNGLLDHAAYDKVCAQAH